MYLDVVQTACELVALPSVNPMGRDLSGDGFYEHRVTEYLERLFARLGVPCQRRPMTPGRENVLAVLEGDPPPAAGGKILMWDAHQDTVPVDGMTIEPWQPVVQDDRLYGRGACDIKGGMAAMLAALSRVATDRPTPRPTLAMACTVDEEFGSAGAAHLTTWWHDAESLLSRVPEAIVVAEPTLLSVVVAHKGTVRWRARVEGRAAHSSDPSQGKSAIYGMSHVVQALERYAGQVLPEQGLHSLLGGPTLNVGLISGGVSVNTVPDACTIEIDRRILPHEDPREAQAQTMRYLEQHVPPDVSLSHEQPYLTNPGLDDDEGNRAFGAALANVAQQCGQSAELVGVPYGTNAPRFAAQGVPTVVFGPGSVQQAHTCDEWVSVDQLHAATEVLDKLARSAWTS